jgi:methyl-accepting chemotaxis protein
VGALALTKMDGIRGSVTFLGTNTAPALRILGDLNTATSDYRAAQLTHVISSSDEDMAKQEEALRSRSAAVEQGFEEYRPTITGAEDREYFERSTKEWAGYVEATEDVVALSRANETAQATKLLSDQQGAFDKLSADLTTWSDLNAKWGEDYRKQAEASAASARTLVIGVLVAAVLLGVVIALLIARGITSGVGQMLRAARGLAQGDVEQRIEVRSRDEIGEMAQAFEQMIAYNRTMVGAADRLAAGDLTHEVEPVSDRDALGLAFARMTATLRELITEMARSAGTVASASQQVASTSEEAGKAVGEIASAVGEVAQGAERQVRTVESAREQTETVADAMRVGTENVAETTEAAVRAREVAEEGAGAVLRATAAMESVRESSQAVTTAIRGLGAKSEQIGGIVDSITGIARQTNLLALNAAIEAARAGEQGRGFAVVAEEVRKLAEESQEAAGSIASLIEEIQLETARAVDVVEDGAQRTTEGAETVERARDAFARIEGSVEDMHGRVAAVAAIMDQVASSSEHMRHEMQEVATVAEQSSAATEQVSASTQETSASTEEIAASAQELAATAEQLEKLVGQFKVAA